MKNLVEWSHAGTELVSVEPKIITQRANLAIYELTNGACAKIVLRTNLNASWYI